jgi:hypothetical protein
MSPSHSSSPVEYPSISDIDKDLMTLAPAAASLERCDTGITPGSCSDDDKTTDDTSRKRRVLASSQPEPLQPGANSNGRSDQSITRSRVCRPLMKLTVSLFDTYNSIKAACSSDGTRNVGTWTMFGEGLDGDAIAHANLLLIQQTSSYPRRNAKYALYRCIGLVLLRC